MAEILIASPAPQPPTSPPVVPVPPIDRPGYLDYEHPISRAKGRFILIMVAVIVVLAFLAYIIMSVMSSRSEPSVPIPSTSPATSVTGVPESFESGPPQDIYTPKIDEVVTSPLTVTGVVPPGWMFEGVMPIKLVDENENIIAEGQATEDEPGSWQSGNRVKFTGMLTFTTTAQSGLVVIEKDNPSGLSENAGTMEQTVRFAN